MSYGFMNIARTPSVRAAQAAMGADHLWHDFKGHREFDRFTHNEAAFIAERDSFYMASVSETGWPYVQHRGGPRGFLKMVDALMARSNSPTLGHPKFPQAGPPDYDDSGATAMRAAASLRR